MDQAISIWFESIRNGFLDAFFLIITEFGDELVFLIISTILFWVVNKELGYKFMLIFLGTITVNDFLKFFIDRPRPWQSGVVSVVGEGSYGHSMPSGHAQGSMTMALALDKNYGKTKKWVSPLLFTMAILVSISRVYLGQHYVSDVLVGIVVAFIVFYAVMKFGPKLKITPQKFVYLISPLLIGLLFVVTEKNFFVAVAAMLALTIGYDLEKKYLNYEIQNRTVLTKVLTYAIGLIIALLLKEGLKMVLPYTTDIDAEMTTLDLWLDFVRYFILCIWVSLGSFAVFHLIFNRNKR
jgi:undecaprenyl-diphosphatase